MAEAFVDKVSQVFRREHFPPSWELQVDGRPLHFIKTGFNRNIHFINGTNSNKYQAYFGAKFFFDVQVQAVNEFLSAPTSGVKNLRFFLWTLLLNGHQRHNKVSSSQGIDGSSNAQKSCLWVLFCGRWWMLSLIMSSSQTSDSFWLLLDSTPPPPSKWLIEDGLVFAVQCVKVFSLTQV